MKGISKLMMLGGAAIVGILALFIGNNPFGNSNNNNHANNVDDGIDVLVEEVPEDEVPEDDLEESLLNFIPTQVLGDQLIEHQYYTVSYSTAHKNPEWVAYELRNSRLFLNNSAPRESFAQDPLSKKDADSKDYTHSGYDRGHLAPAFDMNFNKLAMRESFYMVNIVPQVPEFNRGIWKTLESTVRHWTKRSKRLYVIVGPLLRKDLDEADRLHHQADAPTIPRGYFKIVLDYDGNEKKAIAFMFKNKGIERPISDFVTTIDQVEAYTGINFFPELTEEEELLLESKSNPELWDFR